MMTRNEYIRNYVANNPNPDPKLCPDLVLYWNGTAQKYGGTYTNYYRLRTGQKFINNNPFIDKTTLYYRQDNGENYLMLTPNQIADSAYFKHVTDPSHDIDMLEVGRIYIDNSRPNKALNVDARKWEFCKFSRIFLFKDDFKPYGVTGEYCYTEANGKYYNHEVISDFNNLKYFHIVGAASYQFREFVYGSGEYTKDMDIAGKPKLNTAWQITDFYRNMVPRAVSEKTKAKTAAVNANDIKTFTDIESEVVCNVTRTKITNGSYSYNSYNKLEAFWYIDQDSAKNTIIRYFKTNIHGTDSDFEKLPNGVPTKFEYHLVSEPCRVMISPKNKVSIFKYNNISDSYEATGCQIDTITRWLKANIYNIDKFNDIDNLKDCTSYVKTIHQREQVKGLIQMLRHPMYLELHKNGYSNIAGAIDLDYFESNFKNIFKIDKITKNSLEIVTGLNSHQLASLNEYAEYTTDDYGCKRQVNHNWTRIIPEMKMVLDTDSFSTMSNDDFNYWIQKTNKVLNEDWRGYSGLLTRTPIYGRRKNEKFTEDERTMFKEIFKHEESEPGYLDTWIDTVGIWKSLKNGYFPKDAKLSTDLNKGELDTLYAKCDANISAQWSGKSPAY